jgi:hypothetical protein
MSAENPTLEDFGFDSTALMIEVQRETMGKLIKAEAKIAKLRAALKKAGVMLSQGFSKETVAEHIQAALTNEQEGE